MAFSEETVRSAFLRSKERCECTRVAHKHPYLRCSRQLFWERRGEGGEGYWEAHHKDSNPNNDVLSNCEILCWPCHKATF